MPELEIEYFNPSGERLRTTLGDAGWTEDGGVRRNPALGISFRLETGGDPENRTFSVPRGSIAETGENRLAALVFTPDFLSGREGDDAEFILPCDIGVRCRLSGKPEGEYILPGFSAPKWPDFVMSLLMAAELTPSGARLMILEDCRYDAGFRLRTNFGSEHVYRIDAVFQLRRHPEDRLPEDSPCVRCRRIDGGLAEAAANYRRWLIERLGVTPLSEKFKQSKALRESAESVMIRLRMATKPVPGTIEEQTPENQPEVRVLMDFDAAIRVAEECARQKIPAADFTFVGWNYGGHDGAFPQIFPVEEKLGGEPAMRKAVARIRELGYKVGIHDNFYDSYTLANNLDRSDWAVSPDGEGEKGEIWGGGRSHLLCPERALKRYVPEHLAGLKSFGLNGAYYVDVISLGNLYSCSAPEHPVSLKEAAGCWKKILLKQREFSGVSMSEGAREWALPEVDRAYAAANRPDPHIILSFADGTVPLLPLVLHGLVLYNACRMTINSMPGSDLYLDNIAFGGLPLLYFYQHFQNRISVLNDACDDLTVTTDEKLREEVTRIKRISGDVTRLAPLQSSFIKKYQPVDEKLLRVVYENGTELYVNYHQKAVVLSDGTSVPARDFTLKGQAES